MFCLQYNLPLPTKVCTKDDFYKIVSSDRVIKKIAEFRQLKAEGKDSEADAKKRSLPIFIYQATFEETESKNGKKACWRRQQAAHLNGLVMLDIDHIDNPVHLFGKMPKEWFEEGVKNQVMLVHITPSGKGLRVVFKADADIGDLSANQHHLSRMPVVHRLLPNRRKSSSSTMLSSTIKTMCLKKSLGNSIEMDDVRWMMFNISPQPSALKHHPSALSPHTKVSPMPTLSTNIGNVLAVFLWMANAMCACTS